MKNKKIGICMMGVVFCLVLFIGNVEAKTLFYYRTSYFDNKSNLNWKIYVVDRCPFYSKDRTDIMGCTSFNRDIYIVSGYAYNYNETLEICKHEACHNVYWYKPIVWQEQFCARYSDTLKTVKKADDICKILLGDLKI